LTRQELHQAYSQALAATVAQARTDWRADTAALDAAVGRLKDYYKEVTQESVAELTRLVYADNAYLCDTLHIAHGADEIEAYFRKTAERVSAMRVDILDYTNAGREVYARWTMTIAAPELENGRPVTTFGLSHFRFDAEGKVILHQDFWDASAGFFEQLPVLGGILSRIRGGL
jgi:hypothetical protein